MKIKGIALLAAAGAALAASPAMAQDAYEGSFYVGPQVGYHSLEIDETDPVFTGFNIDDGGVIFGGVIGGDLAVGNSAIVVGAELDANAGKGPVESDYGAVGYIGFQLSPQAQISLRGGYREVRLDLYELTGQTVGQSVTVDRAFGAADDQDGDYTVGIGGRYGLGNFGVRAAVDTISFDSVRGTVALVLMFR